MVNHALADRYAKTLFALSEKENLLDAVHQDFLGLVEVLQSNASFSQFLGNPTIKLQQKSELFSKVFESKMQPLSFRFVQYLVTKNRIEALLSIGESFLEKVNEKLGRCKGVVFSAVPLDSNQIDRIQKAFQQKSNKVYSFTNKIDKSLLGGFKIQIDDLVYDWSIQSKLHNLKRQMLAN